MNNSHFNCEGGRRILAQKACAALDQSLYHQKFSLFYFSNKPFLSDLKNDSIDRYDKLKYLQQIRVFDILDDEIVVSLIKIAISKQSSLITGRTNKEMFAREAQ
jgi:hypothetical protein